jgi:hypothetical protein
VSSPQLNPLHALDEINKAFGLRLEPLEQFGIFQAARLIEQVINAWQA